MKLFVFLTKEYDIHETYCILIKIYDIHETYKKINIYEPDYSVYQ